MAAKPKQEEKQAIEPLIPDDPRCPRCGKRFLPKVGKDYPSMDRMETITVVQHHDGATRRIHSRCKLPVDKEVA